MHLFENAYEITWLLNNVVNKLYHEVLTSEEIEGIVDDLSNRLAKNIENQIERSKNK